MVQWWGAHIDSHGQIRYLEQGVHLWGCCAHIQPHLRLTLQRGQCCLELVTCELVLFMAFAFWTYVQLDNSKPQDRFCFWQQESLYYCFRTWMPVHWIQRFAVLSQVGLCPAWLWNRTSTPPGKSRATAWCADNDATWWLLNCLAIACGTALCARTSLECFCILLLGHWTWYSQIPSVHVFCHEVILQPHARSLR